MNLQKVITSQPSHIPTIMLKSTSLGDVASASCPVCKIKVDLKLEQGLLGVAKCFGNVVIISWPASKVS